MELKEISRYEAQLYELPASYPGEGEMSRWYALMDNGEEDTDNYKGFMETTSYGDIEEITYFLIPDLYQGKGYGNIMLELFLDDFIERSEEKDLVASFEYNTLNGNKISDILSDHGFEISLKALKECTLPFDTVYNKLSSKKPVSYKGKMANLSENIDVVVANAQDLGDAGITARDIKEADIQYSVAAIDASGKLEALLLASRSHDYKEIAVDDLYTATDDVSVLRKFLSFAVENAVNSGETPEFITFVAANEKLEKVMDLFFDSPSTSRLIMAEGEFNLGKYVEQIKLEEELRR